MKLKDKIAIVTGAGGGIGAATAERFAAEGAKVMLVDVRESNLVAIASGIGRDRADYVVADVSDPNDVQSFTSRTVERFGGLDVMFANAGIEGASRRSRNTRSRSSIGCSRSTCGAPFSAFDTLRRSLRRAAAARYS